MMELIITFVGEIPKLAVEKVFAIAEMVNTCKIFIQTWAILYLVCYPFQTSLSQSV